MILTSSLLSDEKKKYHVKQKKRAHQTEFPKKKTKESNES